MKLPQFEYTSPTTLDEAIALLASRAGEAKPIAGGQSLIPILAFRLGAPALLVDLKRVPGLDHITLDDNGVRLGALVRWRDIEHDAGLAQAYPLLVCAVGHVGHYQIRNRGTVGGSLAHADPAAEMPGIAVTCDAKISVVGPAGARTITAANFFGDTLVTELAPDELIVELRLPRWPAQRRWGFEEFSRRRGDFAMAGISLYYDEDWRGRAIGAHVGVFGVGNRPQRLADAEDAINGRLLDEQAIMAAAQAAAAAVDPPDDVHASAAYRKNLVATLLERALKQAATRSRGSNP
jgi:carbon-monoxide dehydrogenase medium subunit